jgi:hypothetical protein
VQIVDMHTKKLMTLILVQLIEKCGYAGLVLRAHHITVNAESPVTTQVEILLGTLT